MWIYLYLSVVFQLLHPLQQEKCYGAEFNSEDLKAGEGEELLFVSKQVMVKTLVLSLCFSCFEVLLFYSCITKREKKGKHCLFTLFSFE